MKSLQVTEICCSEWIVFNDVAVTFHKCYDTQRNDSV